jgi:hypothetical protein
MLAGLFLLMVTTVAGCGDSVREIMMKEKYPSYPPEIREAIDKGYVVKGMDVTQVELALGPTPCIKTRSEGQKAYATWEYALNKSTYKVVIPEHCFDSQYAPYTVIFEDGRVTQVDY